jgi:hypothetical protein
MSTFFYGCAASTRVVKNDKVEINTQDYVELYFIKPTKDPRPVVPQVIEEFKNKFGWGTSSGGGRDVVENRIPEK